MILLWLEWLRLFAAVPGIWVGIFGSCVQSAKAFLAGISECPPLFAQFAYGDYVWFHQSRGVSPELSLLAASDVCVYVCECVCV